MKFDISSALVWLVVMGCLGSPACATRRHVREAVAPATESMRQTQDQARALSNQINANQERIGDLDRRLASAQEKTSVAERANRETMVLANRALETATNAAQRADVAASTARDAQRALAQTDQRIGGISENLTGYRLVFSEKIYFDFSQSRLAVEERRKLERAIRHIRGMKNYMVEIEGFADSSGDALANRKLSRKRADAVVHCLVVEHDIPLRAVWELGAGADFPSADNQTPSARRENRRVDVRVYSRGAPL